MISLSVLLAWLAAGVGGRRVVEDLVAAVRCGRREGDPRLPVARLGGDVGRLVGHVRVLELQRGRRSGAAHEAREVDARDAEARDRSRGAASTGLTPAMCLLAASKVERLRRDERLDQLPGRDDHRPVRPPDRGPGAGDVTGTRVDDDANLALGDQQPLRTRLRDRRARALLMTREGDPGEAGVERAQPDHRRERGGAVRGRKGLPAGARGDQDAGGDEHRGDGEESFHVQDIDSGAARCHPSMQGQQPPQAVRRAGLVA